MGNFNEGSTDAPQWNRRDARGRAINFSIGPSGDGAAANEWKVIFGTWGEDLREALSASLTFALGLLTVSILPPSGYIFFPQSFPAVVRIAEPFGLPEFLLTPPSSQERATRLFVPLPDHPSFDTQTLCPFVSKSSIQLLINYFPPLSCFSRSPFVTSRSLTGVSCILYCSSFICYQPPRVPFPRFSLSRLSLAFLVISAEGVLLSLSRQYTIFQFPMLPVFTFRFWSPCSGLAVVDRALFSFVVAPPGSPGYSLCLSIIPLKLTRLGEEIGVG